MLSVKDVAVRFEIKGRASVAALERISLTVDDNQFSAIVGPSGCGKSTLLRLVAGLQPSMEGYLTLDGDPVLGPSAERGMVFQSYTLFPWLTVKRNIEFGLDIKNMEKASKEEISADLIRAVGMVGFEDAYPDQLSGGMRQRTALARALANDPKILLMDEPFGALDSQTRQIMQELLLEIWERNQKTVLFVTHDIDEAIFLADVVHVMTARPGRIKRSLTIDIPRPRGYQVLTSEKFVKYKRDVLGLIHDEALRADRN